MVIIAEEFEGEAPKIPFKFQRGSAANEPKKRKIRQHKPFSKRKHQNNEQF